MSENNNEDRESKIIGILNELLLSVTHIVKRVSQLEDEIESIKEHYNYDRKES